MDHGHVPHARSGAESAPPWNPALRREKEPVSAPTAKLPPQIEPGSSSEEESEEEEEEKEEEEKEEEEEEDDEDEDEEEEEESEDDDGEEETPVVAAAAIPKSAPIAASDSAQDSEDDDGEDEAPVTAAIPKSTPIAASDSAQDSEDDDGEDEAPVTAAIPKSAPIAASDSAQDSEGDSEDDSDAPSDLPEPAPSTQALQDVAEERVEANDMEEDALVNAAQALNISEHPAAVETKVDSSDAAESEEESEEEESSEEEIAADEHPADNYEHQGEATALEEAVNESVNIPLVDDAAPESDDWGDSGDTFDIGGQQQDPSLETPQAEAVGTTVGDDVIGNTTVGGNAGDDLDWGTAEEVEDFFGGGVNRTVEETTEPAEPITSPGAHVVQTPEVAPAKSEWDLDLDLDEDFLPDNEDGPVIELSDDEGFLDDEPPAPAQVLTSTSAGGASRYAPPAIQALQSSMPTSNPYAPQGQFTNPPQGALSRSVTSPAGAYNGYGQNVAYQQQQPTRPAMASSSQSYVAKSKGGYASPYDMPDDIVTTRKRAVPRTTVPATQPTPPPPPRTSSISSSSAPPRPLPPSNASVTSLSPPPPGHSIQGQMTGLPPVAPLKPAPPAKTASSDFFAELPVTSKPKPPGRYTPQPAAAAQSPPLQGPPQFPMKERTASWSSLRNEVLPDAVSAQPHLRQPEQLAMFPSQPSVPARQNSLPIPQSTAPPSTSRYSPAPPSVPVANARYSPVPPNTQAGANPRYSPAPQGQGASHARYVSEPPGSARTPSQTYAPRTSSPLAFPSMPHQHESSANVPEQQLPGHHMTQSADGMPRAPFKSPLEGVSEALEQESAPSDRRPMTARSETPPPRSSASSAVGSPRKKGNYTPQYQSMNPIAPSRSLTQSPATSMKYSGAMYGVPPSAAAYGSYVHEAATTNVIPHRRQASINYECIAPEDERAMDPLQRYKGHPVFTWGLGGTVVTTFPKQIPRYGGGMTAPMVKCIPGEVKIQSVKDVLPLTEDLVKFPGPLKSKSKKKDVLSWLAKKSEVLESQMKDPTLEHSLSADQLKRLEEKILLLKLLHFLVENDGRLEGEAANTEFKKLFSPQDDSTPDAEGSFSTAADIVGRSRSNTANVAAEPIDARAIEDLQKMLARGEREKAVWHAVDQRLWGHAMLLSSTLSKDIWKQVVQEFVRNEVKKVGRSNQALAVLYEVFAGNHEDCIDELVPASARAGFQMVSADGTGPAQNAQQGLDKWRETIALILNNRSEGDVLALLSLGKLLSQYGRVEAAQICFILGRSVAHISGVDDVLADLVLIGIDHKQHPNDLGVDMEPILLTEVYEFALSLSAQVNSHIIPHLQNYKLAHAYHLAEHGYRTEAQAYCDAIAAAIKATTRPSPYYNASFIASLDDLGKRLSQSPKDNSSSWISKPSMDRVGTSLMSKFNSFIAGEDDGPSSSTATGTEAGPFANIAADSPSLTPSHSNADLYGAYSGYGAPTQPAASMNSRYAPSNAYAPRTSSEQQRSRYEPQGRPSMESNDSHRAMSDSYMPMTPMTPASGPYSPQPQLSPPSQRTQAKMQSYSPLRAEHNAAQPSYGNPYMPTPPNDSAAVPSFGGYQPQQPEASHSFDDPAPPTSSFDEPSYQPYNPDEDDKEEDDKPKKKSFMDDDDDEDLIARAAALKIGSSSKPKSDADKKADEAFRKAAEADAKRDKENAAKKAGGGWLSGWFKKDPNAAPGPIKAKLGEESSFYYDPDLGKWVNKKAGSNEPERAAATPPPPKGPSMANRSASSGMPPPSAPSTSNPTLMRPPTSAPQRSSSMPPPMAVPGSRSSTPGIPSDTEGGPKPPTLARPSFGAASGPPSRPGTGMSNASSIDDLLGAPQARKGAAGKKKKGGRYVDVFPQGQAS